MSIEFILCTFRKKEIVIFFFSFTEKLELLPTKPVEILAVEALQNRLAFF